MFKNLPPIASISIRNGAISGLLGFFILLALYFIGKHPFLFMIFSDFRIVLFGIFMVLTLKEIRDSHQDGIIFFWQGMIANLIFTFLFVLITFFAIWILCEIYPPFLTNYITTATEQMMSISKEVIAQMGKQSYDSNLKAISGTNGYILAKHYSGQSFIISFFISIIISVILRRQPKLE